MPHRDPSGHGASVARPRLELADVVRAHGHTFQRMHRLARVQAVALRAIERCRTAALGGHRETCDRCGAVRLRYHSSGNRHCPKCQTLPEERWLAARKADLLPIPYFHVVFTLPHALNALAQGNPRVIYALLFRAAADTLLTFGRDPRHLGGTVGITAIPHTWGQALTQHLHLHCLVTGGALAADPSRWIAGRPSFLFPVRALSTVFRAKYLAGLPRAYHRDGRVPYRLKDYADHDRVKLRTLDADEFLRQFLLHVVPRGFMRIRHFGLLANRTRRGMVTRCRDLLGHPPMEDVPPESVTVLLPRLTGVDRSRCAVCGEGRMHITAIVGRVTPVADTS